MCKRPLAAQSAITNKCALRDAAKFGKYVSSVKPLKKENADHGDRCNAQQADQSPEVKHVFQINSGEEIAANDFKHVAGSCNEAREPIPKHCIGDDCPYCPENDDLVWKLEGKVCIFPPDKNTEEPGQDNKPDKS